MKLKTRADMVRWSLAILLFWISTVLSAALPVRLSEGAELPSLAPMLKGAAPAVVNIATFTTVKQVNPLLQDPFFRRFFQIPEGYSNERRTQSAGSGVIVDAAKGYILTNHHVVERADEILVTLKDGREIQARFIGSDKQVDIALLQIEAEDLDAIPLSNSSSLEVGDFVVAIGNPFGLGQTVTSGIVSALGRSGLGIHGYEDFIQTDASINPGNSGGALVNLRGDLVGINSAIVAPAGGNVGIGFAIPTEIAVNVMQQLIEHGVVRRGRLGVAFQDVTPELAEAFDLKLSSGALIAKVVAQSPADKAGLRPGDIVVSVDGRKVRKASDLRTRIGLKPIGQVMKIELLRRGEPKVVEAVITETPLEQIDGGVLHAKFKGVTLKDYVSNETGETVAIEIIAIENQEALKAGLQQGDLIIAANKARVKSVAELKQRADGGDLLLHIERKGKRFYFVISE